MMRSSALLTVATILHGVAVVAGMDSAIAQGNLRCETQAPPFGDRRDIECPLNAAATAQRFRFKANFSGGHDDTRASITATINDAPLACDAGSKTSLFGEDGDVSLECRFRVAEKTDTKQVLKVTIRWYHAQYTDFELDSE
jgi:hypothetical protein